MASIKDVAMRAGVSISTVSNVITGKRYVSNELSEKVYQTIRELNYEVDLVARSLKNNRSMTIGVIITSLNRIFIPQVLNGIQKRAEEMGFHLLIYTTNDNLEDEKRYLQLLVSSRVDGIIIDTVADISDINYYRRLANLHKGDTKIPVVCIERNLSEHSVYSIYADNVKGAYMAVEHLIESGCQKIAHISGPPGIEMVLYRTKGYERALEKYGLKEHKRYTEFGDFSPISGYRAVKHLLTDGIEFDGVFADNDQMAVGAMKALSEFNIRIPDKVKIVGFDNTFVSSLVKPSLSTINVPKYRMGWEAADIICEMVNNTEKQDEWKNQAQELMTSLLVRESTNGEKNENWDLEGW